MRALVADRSAPSGVSLREAPDPEPGSGEALLEVRAVSLNRGEVRRLPLREEGTIPGWDIAGVVRRAAADGSGPAEGARAVALADEGGWAELAVAPTARMAELPDGVSFADASTLPVAGLTAVRALEVGGPLLGRRVLVTGAAGGVGRFAVQLAHRAGAHVTGVVRSPERGAGPARDRRRRARHRARARGRAVRPHPRVRRRRQPGRRVHARRMAGHDRHVRRLLARADDLQDRDLLQPRRPAPLRPPRLPRARVPRLRAARPAPARGRARRRPARPGDRPHRQPVGAGRGASGAAGPARGRQGRAHGRLIASTSFFGATTQ